MIQTYSFFEPFSSRIDGFICNDTCLYFLKGHFADTFSYNTKSTFYELIKMVFVFLTPSRKNVNEVYYD